MAQPPPEPLPPPALPPVPPVPPPPPPPYPGYGYASVPTDGRATAALVVGIVAVVGLFCYGIPAIILGPIAIFLGLSARRHIKASGGAVGGGGIAMAGWILGLLATVLGILILAVVVFGFVLLAVWSGVQSTPVPATPQVSGV